MNRKSALSTQNKITIYKALIKPVLLYAASIWSSAANTHIKKMQTVQNKILRMITKADRYTINQEIRDICKLEDIETCINDITHIFYQEKPILNIVNTLNKMYPSN